MLAGRTMAEAVSRFALVNSDLSASQQASVSVGLAELAPDDSVEDLVGRADEATYAKRKQPRSARD